MHFRDYRDVQLVNHIPPCLMKHIVNPVLLGFFQLFGSPNQNLVTTITQVFQNTFLVVRLIFISSGG
jgi:hypothetical protein